VEENSVDPIQHETTLPFCMLLCPYVSSPTPVEKRTTFRGVNPEDAESSSDAECTVVFDEVVLLRKGKSLDILDCSFAVNNDADALRLERGVEGTLDGRLESEASEADGVRGTGEVLLCVMRVPPEAELGFLSEERGGGGGNIRVGVDSLLRCTCREERRVAGALWGVWGKSMLSRRRERGWCA